MDTRIIDAAVNFARNHGIQLGVFDQETRQASITDPVADVERHIAHCEEPERKRLARLWKQMMKRWMA